MSLPSLNLRLRADAAYARHEGHGERAKLLEEAADAIERLQRREAELLREVQTINPLRR